MPEKRENALHDRIDTKTAIQARLFQKRYVGQAFVLDMNRPHILHPHSDVGSSGLTAFFFRA